MDVYGWAGLNDMHLRTTIHHTCVVIERLHEIEDEDLRISVDAIGEAIERWRVLRDACAIAVGWL